MKAASSISASSSDKAFGLSAGNASSGQSSGGAGFLAMLDGMIASSGAGSGAFNTTSDQGKNGQSQSDADMGDDETVTALSGAEDAQDEVNLPSSVDASSALPVAAQQAAQPIIASAALAPVTTQPIATKTTAPASVPVSDDALAAIAVQAGLVPVVQAQGAQIPNAAAAVAQPPIAQAQAAPVQSAAQTATLVSASAPAPVPVSVLAPLPVATPAPAVSAPASIVANDDNQTVPVLAAQTLQTAPVASSDAAVAIASAPVSAKAQTAPQSDQDNSDTQQSAILSALFAQAPLQVLPPVSSAESSSAKPVSGVSNAGIASVPGVGIPPMLSPPAIVGNGSNSVSAHLLASSSNEGDAAAPVAAPAVRSADMTPSFGIGTSLTASGSDGDAADDAAASAQAPVAAAGDQVKAEAIASLFTAPSVKTVKTDDADAKDDAVAGVAPVSSADIASTGITLVHQTSTTGVTTASSTVSASAQAYTSSPADQVSLTLQRATNNGPQTMTIALSPVELGKVEVKLDFAKDGSVQASVTADRPETLTLLKNDHSTLTQALHNAGLTTTSSSLSFNLRDGGASQQQQQGFGSASSYRPGSSAASADADATASPSSITTVHYAVSNGNGRLDVTV